MLLESFRVQAGKSGLLPALVSFLSSPEVSTRLQVLRAIGNLCIDNGNSSCVHDVSPYYNVSPSACVAVV